jgi:hypothetical protein
MQRLFAHNINHFLCPWTTCFTQVWDFNEMVCVTRLRSKTIPAQEGPAFSMAISQ